MSYNKLYDTIYTLILKFDRKKKKIINIYYKKVE